VEEEEEEMEEEGSEGECEIVGGGVVEECVEVGRVLEELGGGGEEKGRIWGGVVVRGKSVRKEVSKVVRKVGV
ncbi:hypothetical protein, partial [Prescottella equi]|uniref:hypothetical protein n=1 Tax=Rhodococcus hoagii TaxID=43767 RepID=UPI00164252A1